MLNSLGYSIKQAFLQVMRNRAMSIASLFSITAMLLILGAFFVLTVNISVGMETAKMDFDTISVYLEDETTKEEADTMLLQLNGMVQVKDAVYLSKDVAMAQWKEQQWGENSYLLDSLPENPLPNSLEVTVESLENADAVVSVIKTFSGIEDIKYYKDTVDKLMKVTNSANVVMAVIMTALVIVSIVVVSNTVKLTVFARKREIEIMKYVGATNWFIRGPFLIEGIIIGLIAAAISAFAITYLYAELVDAVGMDVSLILGSQMVPVKFLMVNMIWVFAALGVSIGASGSIVSIRKFLDT